MKADVNSATKRRELSILIVSLVLICIVILAGFLIVWVPSLWVIGSAFFIIAFGVWIKLVRSGDDFEVLLLLLFIIGYLQGLLDKTLLVNASQTIWGISKYSLIILIFVGYILRHRHGMPIIVNKAIFAWLIIWGLNWLVLGILIFEASIQSPLYSPIATIQQFAIGNMFLALVIYFQTRQNQIDRWLNVVIYAGLLASMFGVIQRILGPHRLGIFGMSIETLLSSMAFLPSSDPNTNFLDLEHGFRAFSFFDTHHAFSAFLILAVVALQIRRSQGKSSWGLYMLFMIILWAGFAVTFNLTNMLTCILALFIMIILKENERIKPVLRVLLSKRLWSILTKVVIVGLLLIAVISPLRNRFIGIFEIRKGATGAGGSLAYRIEGFVSGLQAIIDYPLGFGLFLNSTGNLSANPELNRYARVNDYFSKRGAFFSGDNWFQWLMVQIGLPGFIIWSSTFIIPIIWGWKWRNRISDPNLRILAYGCLALTSAVFIAGVSNSPVLAFPPSNLLFWAIVGILFKIPDWDQKFRKLENAHWN
jgi:hypothetical protein